MKKIKDPKWENKLSHRRPYIWHRPGKGVLETRIEQIEEATGLSRKQFMQESKEFFIKEKDLVAYMVAVDPKNPMRRVKGITWYEYGMRDMIRTILSMSRRIDELEKKFEKMEGETKQGGRKAALHKNRGGEVHGAHDVQRGYHHLEQALRGRGAGEKFSDLELAARRAAARLQRRRSRPSGTGITPNQQIEIDRADPDSGDA